MSDDKTEQPTEKRLRKARVDGALLAVGVGMLMAPGDKMVDGLRSCISIALKFVAGPHDMTTLLLAVNQIGSRMAGALLPMIGPAILAAVAALAGQTGIVISMKAVSLKFENISPMAGIKRIFS